MTVLHNLSPREWRAAYSHLAASPRPAAAEVVEVVNRAVQSAMAVFEAEGWGAETSDDAESFTGCTLWYFVASNPSVRGLLAEVLAEA